MSPKKQRLKFVGVEERVAAEEEVANVAAPWRLTGMRCRSGRGAVLLGLAGLALVLVLGTSTVGDEGHLPPFKRGDCNGDGSVDVSDAVYDLLFLFANRPAPIRLDALDANDDGRLAISDAIYLLEYLFRGGAAPPAPFPDAGGDPTEDDLDVPVPPPSVDPLVTPTQATKITISGESLPGLPVRVSGRSEAFETLTAGDGRFAVDVELLPNRLNLLFVTTVDEHGQTSSPTPLLVVQDSQAPRLFIDLPAGDATVTDPAVTVVGRVADRLSGLFGLVVEVNGERAEVDVGIGTNGTSERSGVPLALGTNTITATARDIAGNVATREVTVTRIEPDPDVSMISALAGNNQSGVVKERLAQSLQVGLTDADGEPNADKFVLFEVLRSDGALAAAPERTEARRVQVRTDSNGLTSVVYRLGSDAGCGNNRVRASAADMPGEVIFCASATAGSASQINIGSGNNQVGEVNSDAPHPLRAWVSDSLNGLPGVPVTFSVVDGAGLVNGKPEVTVPSTLTGHAIVEFTFGSETGVQRVAADFDGNTTSPALFQHVAVVRDSELTTLSGLVLDNGDTPLVGATCRLEMPGKDELQTMTGVDGSFTFDDISGDGFAHLSVDGVSVTAIGGEAPNAIEAESFPALGLDLVIIPLARNALPSPIVLPRLDPDSRRIYDGTEDVRLAVDGIDGFEVFVRANSVTLEDGSVPSPEEPVTLYRDLVLAK